MKSSGKLDWKYVVALLSPGKTRLATYCPWSAMIPQVSFKHGCKGYCQSPKQKSTDANCALPKEALIFASKFSIRLCSAPVQALIGLIKQFMFTIVLESLVTRCGAAYQDVCELAPRRQVNKLEMERP